jgi:prepilin-type N-terminal cleavage/methylation domain-containing protein
MKTSLPKHRRGFTLVEILAVVAIIGLLAAILVPNIMTANRTTKQSLAGNNLRSIVVAYSAYSKGGEQIITRGEVENGGANNVAQFAEVLARKAGFANAKVWYIDTDQRPASKAIPDLVIEDGTNSMVSVKPAAWAVVLNAKRNKFQSSTYPLAWTRGLGSDGKWNKESSPWGDEGGHVAFGDGHVDWKTNTSDRKNQFFKADGNDNTRVTSYQDAIGTSSSGEESSSPERVED